MLRRVLPWLACCGALACTVKQQPRPSEFVCDGPNCLDASAEMGGTEINFDAAPSETDNSPPPESASDAGALPLICTGGCALDDELACPARRLSEALDPTSDAPSLAREERQYPPHFQLSGSVGLDAGSALEVDASLSDANLADPDAAVEFPSAADASSAAPQSGADAAQPGAGTAGAGDASTVDESGAPGVEPLDPREAGVSLTADAGTSPIRSCQLTVEGGKWAPRCREVVGQGGDVGAACASSRDCLPGLGCVGLGRCQPYCCGGEAECGVGRFCAQRPLRTLESTEQPLMVPVCEVPQKCDLAEPFPCSDPAECVCVGGTACTIVDASGATSCEAVTGDGTQDEPCPCAAGYLCSKASQTCLKLCEEGESSEPQGDGTMRVRCGEGATCSTNANFPEGWGLCVTLTEMSPP